MGKFMRTKFNWLITVLLWIAPMLGAYSNEEAPLVEQKSAICTINRTIDLDCSRKLRDLVRDQNSFIGTPSPVTERPRRVDIAVFFCNECGVRGISC